ncbi:MAG: sigma 54-interacting transcriptional regulator [Tissierellia bacterium]|nr:sigma 54-interacting transcriptional regulator [Tissierellia bacterium]
MRLSQKELDEVLKKNSQLISFSKPFMEDLYSFVKGSGFAVVLTDANACILEVLGDKEIVEDSEDKDNLRKGCIWKEEYVGNTAVSTCIFEGRPIQISGKEHYCKVFKNWTCSSAPIKEDGKLIGVLSVRGYDWNSHSHTLGMVVAAARAIENKIVLEKAKAEIILRTKYQSAIAECIPDGFLTIDNKGILTYINQTGADILGIDRESSIGRPIEELVDFEPVILNVLKTGKGYVDKEFIMTNNKNGLKYHFIKTAEPIRDDEGNIIGAIDNFRKITRVHKMMRKLVGNYGKFTFDDIIGSSEKIKESIRLAKIAARSSSNVLIYGESGTGKELLVQSIHNASSRRNESLVSINCAAIPSELIESELFGYEGGAFTGALKNGQIGKFELASGGTLFLDEIGDMPLHMQAKLLRVLQENQIIRVGGKDIIDIDVRIISATNKDLLHECKNGNFREDLYYRLNVLYIVLPPLRERKEDIEELVYHFIKKINNKIGSNIEGVSPEVIDYFMKYDWPGNVRELENILERAINFLDGDLVIRPQHLPSKITGITRYREIDSLKSILEEVEKQTIIDSLIIAKGNKTLAANMLKISRTSLYEKIMKYNIDI